MNDKTYNMRLPLELFEKLRQCADEHKRSINKELEYIITLYVNRTKSR